MKQSEREQGVAIRWRVKQRKGVSQSTGIVYESAKLLILSSVES